MPSSTLHLMKQPKAQQINQVNNNNDIVKCKIEMHQQYNKTSCNCVCVKYCTSSVEKNVINSITNTISITLP